MFVLVPVENTDSLVSASNLPETEHTAWAIGTTYAVGDRVRVVTASLTKSPNEAWVAGDRLYWSATLNRATTTVIGGAYIGHATAAAALATTTGTVSIHGVYESLAASNLGNNPVSDVFAATPKWAKVGATNKFKPFDQTVSGQASGATSITYTLAVPSNCNGLALLNLSADVVEVLVKDSGGITVWSYERTLVAPNPITDWWEYYAWDPLADPIGEDVESELLLTGFSAYSGYTIEITLTAGIARVGEIVLGEVKKLGVTGAGTEVGYISYSRKDRDQWGNALLIERESADTTVFRFLIQPVTDMRRVRRLIAAMDDIPAVWFAGAGPTTTSYGTTVYGFVAGNGFRAPLEVEGAHIASLEIEGLT